MNQFSKNIFQRPILEKITSVPKIRGTIGLQLHLSSFSNRHAFLIVQHEKFSVGFEAVMV